MESAQCVGGMGKGPSIPEILNGGIVVIEREYNLWIEESMLSLLQQKVWSPGEDCLDVLFCQLVV